jgi:hypothetical protein
MQADTNHSKLVVRATGLLVIEVVNSNPMAILIMRASRARAWETGAKFRRSLSSES